MNTLSRSALLALSLALAPFVAGCSGSDSDEPRVRLLNLSPGYESISLYLDDTQTIAGVAYGAMSEYVTVGEDTYDADFRRTGVSGTLREISEDLTGDTHRTFVTYGTLGRFNVAQLTEDGDEDDIDEGDSSVRLLHGANEAGPLDVYLTASDASLDDVAATFSGVAGASLVDFATIDSGTYRLRITAAGSKTDIRLDVTGLTFATESFNTLILSATSGGMLVNASLLPQQQAASPFGNAYARVRAAIGLGDAASATIRVGGVSLVSAQPASTVGGYRLVEGGTRAGVLAVDGSSFNLGNFTLAAGGDYTLLTRGAEGSQSVLLTDDNRTASSTGYTKIRLVNAVMGIEDPLSLAVDFFPVAEGVSLGEASESTELLPTIDSRLDVTNSTTAARLYTQSSTTLQGSAVYTMFMFGTPSEPIGVLRKDR